MNDNDRKYPGDREDIKQLNSLLVKHLKCTNDVDVTFDLCNRTLYYIENKKTELWKQFKINIPLLHKHFGRGGFVCNFANGSDVQRMNINRDILKFHVSKTFLTNKSQNIGDFDLLWFPLNVLNKYWPPRSEDENQRNNYRIKTQYNFNIIVYVDFPRNMNYIMFSCILDANTSSEKWAIQKYIKNTKKMKVRTFAKKFPKFYASIHTHVLSDNTVRIERNMNELRLENTFSHSDDKSVEQWFQIIKNAFFSLFLRFVDKKRKDELCAQLESVFAGKLKQLLFDKINQCLIENDKGETLTYQSLQTKNFTVASEFTFIILMEMSKLENFYQILKDYVGIENMQRYLVRQLNKHMKREREWKLFVKRLVGRTCTYCNEREKRIVNNFECFRICACKICRYCSRLCQKRHWKQRHRFECNSYIFTKMICLN
eukprot:523463_1